MKKTGKYKTAKAQINAILFVCVFTCFLLSGCDSLRFAPSEAQKQNAWLHNRTTMMAAQTAKVESASDKLRALTQLSEVQSQALSSFYGPPKEFPQAETAEDVLAESNWQLARTALQQGAERPDAWEVADSMLGAGYRDLCVAWWSLWNKSGWILKTSKDKIESPAGDYCQQRTL